MNTGFSQRIFVFRDLSMVFPNWIINILLNSVLQNIDPGEDVLYSFTEELHDRCWFGKNIYMYE